MINPTPKELRRIYKWAILTPMERHNYVLKAMKGLPEDSNKHPITTYQHILKKAGIHYWKTKGKYLAEIDVYNEETLRQPWKWITGLTANPSYARDLFMRFNGIGRKTASMLANFCLGTKFAILDTHVLQWMVDTDLLRPDFTLKSNKDYDYAEEKYLEYCKLEGIDPVDLDFNIWKNGAKRKTFQLESGFPEEDWRAIQN